MISEKLGRHGSDRRVAGDLRRCEDPCRPILAAQTDFTEAGELQLSITEDQLDFLNDTMQTQGLLSSAQKVGFILFPSPICLRLWIAGSLRPGARSAAKSRLPVWVIRDTFTVYARLPFSSQLQTFVASH